jgi:hypothetical protein
MDPRVRKRYLRELEASKDHIGKNPEEFKPDFESAPWLFSLLCSPGRETKIDLDNMNK